MKKTLIISALFLMQSYAAEAQTVTTLSGSPELAGYSATSTTVANAQYTGPAGICIDTTGKLWVSEEGGHRIKYLNLGGDVVYTRSGYPGDPVDVGSAGYENKSGIASKYSSPYGIAVDPVTNNFYIADQLNHCIRKLDKFTQLANPQNTSTFAGEGSSNINIGDYKDGTGTAARFNNPMDVVVDANGIVYVADAFNHCIRKITPAGVVTTLAGTPTVSGFADGAAAAAKFDMPVAVELLNATTLLVADANNHRVRAISLLTGAVSTYAGTSTLGGTDGSLATATLRAPSGLAVDKKGNVFVSDGQDGQANTIRKISGAQVSTVAGTYNEIGPDDGSDKDAKFNSPAHIIFNFDKNILYVADKGNHTIRAINMVPVANFSVTNTTVPPATEIAITNTSLNKPTTYLCEITPSAGVTFTPGFGNTSANPKVTFANLGKYNIKLTVSNDYGTDVEEKSSYITVDAANGQPLADFSASAQTIALNDVVNFTDISTNSPTSWEWSFSPNSITYTGGTSASSQNPKVQFTQNNTSYDVTLKVTNSKGNSTSVKKGYITVGVASVKNIHAIAASIYPNPSKGDITIAPVPSENTNLSIALFDMTGKLYMENTIINNQPYTLKTEGLAKGMYIISLFDGKTKMNQKIILE